MHKTITISIIGCIMAFMLTACAPSLTMAPLDRDLAAKRFESPPDKARIYVYRPSKMAAALVAYEVMMDGKTWGALNIDNYLYLDVSPGKHIVSLSSLAVVEIEAEAGHIYFLEMYPGMTKFVLRQVSEEKGKASVKKSKLVMSLLK
jgi:hypothetical protein